MINGSESDVRRFTSVSEVFAKFCDLWICSCRTYRSQEKSGSDAFSLASDMPFASHCSALVWLNFVPFLLNSCEIISGDYFIFKCLSMKLKAQSLSILNA